VQHAKRIPRKICDLAHWENVGTEHVQVEMHSTHTSLFLTLFSQLPTIQEILAQAISKFAISSTRQKGYHGILLAVSSVMESASMSQFTPINIGLLHNKYEYGTHLERACFIL